MKAYWVIAAVMSLVSGTAFVEAAPPPNQQDVAPVNFVEQPGVMEFSGEMIARLWPARHWIDQGLSQQDSAQRHARGIDLVRGRYRIVEHQRQIDHYIFEVPDGSSENEIAAELLDTGLFKFVEPNWRVYPTGCPNDPRFGEQWHHDAAHFGSCAGWDLHTGNPPVGVGICDTGVRFTHEDLQLHRREGYNAVDRLWESQGGRINDIFGHGTEATGTAAANGDNGIGVSGIGWNLSHRMLRVTNSQGGGSTIAILNHAAITAIQAGDKVASLSYSGVENQATSDAATFIKSIGGLMIWAAGNAGRSMNMNHRDADDVIVVGAVNRFEQHESWSNFGQFVDLVAYGSEVRTVSSSGDRSYRDFGGTSAACPQTSGLAATIWSANPSLTPDEVEQILKSTVVDLGAQGQDNTFGYGRIHVGAALREAVGQATPATLTGFEIVTGTLLGGGLGDLGASDDSYLHARSGFGSTLTELHKMGLVIHANTSVASPTDLAMTIESRIDEPTGLANVSLRNWTTGAFEQVDTFAIGNADSVEVIPGIDAANYVNGSGDIDALLKHLVFVPFLAFDFESFVDEVRIDVN